MIQTISKERETFCPNFHSDLVRNNRIAAPLTTFLTENLLSFAEQVEKMPGISCKYSAYY